MRAIRVGITDALDNREVPLVVKRLKPSQLWIEARVGIEPQNLVSVQAKFWPCAVVGIVGEGHDHVQAIVAACHLEHDEDGAVLAGRHLGEGIGGERVEGEESFLKEKRERPGGRGAKHRSAEKAAAGMKSRVHIR